MEIPLDQNALFLRFAIALFAGVFIGLQREYASDNPDQELAAGVRTFALFSLLGCTSGLVAELMHSVWPVLMIFMVVGILIAINYSIQANQGWRGLTTEMAALLTVLIGVLIFLNYLAVGIALTVITTVLLSFKLEMHRFVRKIHRDDIFATLKFAVITAIVLPVLPNKAFGPEPFQIFNPFKIWLLVILMSGISFVGYGLMKIVGTQKGIGLTGILGGLVSSTAVTLTFTQKSKTHVTLSRSFAFAVLLAWTVMYGRVFLEVGVVNPKVLVHLWQPLLALTGVGLIYILYLYWFSKKKSPVQEVEFSNPFQIGPAIKFALIFVVVLLIAQIAKYYWGETGIYLSSFVSGLADVDAIALSLTQMTLGVDGISETLAAKAILVAALSNTLTKGVLVLSLGARDLGKYVLPGLLLMISVGVGAIFLI